MAVRVAWHEVVGPRRERHVAAVGRGRRPVAVRRRVAASGGDTHPRRRALRGPRGGRRDRAHDEDGEHDRDMASAPPVPLRHKRSYHRWGHREEGRRHGRPTFIFDEQVANRRAASVRSPRVGWPSARRRRPWGYPLATALCVFGAAYQANLAAAASSSPTRASDGAKVVVLWGRRFRAFVVAGFAMLRRPGNPAGPLAGQPPPNGGLPEGAAVVRWRQWGRSPRQARGRSEATRRSNLDGCSFEGVITEGPGTHDA